MLIKQGFLLKDRVEESRQHEEEEFLETLRRELTTRIQLESIRLGRILLF